MKTKLILFLAFLCTTLGVYIATIFPSRAKETKQVVPIVTENNPKIKPIEIVVSPKPQTKAIPVIKPIETKPNPFIQAIEASTICAAVQYITYDNYSNMDLVGDFIRYHNPDSDMSTFFAEDGPLRTKTAKKTNEWDDKFFRFVYAIRLMNDSSLAKQPSRAKEEAFEIFQNLSQQETGSLMYALGVIYAQKKIGWDAKKMQNAVREASLKSNWQDDGSRFTQKISQIAWLSPKHLAVANELLDTVPNKIYGDFFNTVSEAISEVDGIFQTEYKDEIAQTIVSELLRSRVGKMSGGYSWSAFSFAEDMLKSRVYRGTPFNYTYLENQINPNTTNLPSRPYIGRDYCTSEKEIQFENYFYENRSFF